MNTILSPKVSFSDVLRPFIDSRALAGVSIGIADRTNFLCLEAAGFADIENAKPMRTDSVVWIASMTKPVTGVAVSMLVDQGKISLDDPVDKYLPHFKNLWLSVYTAPDCMVLRKPERLPTIREMLSNTSGMVFSAPTEWPLDELNLRESSRIYALTPLMAPPGTRYNYSNQGFNVCGRIIELVTGQSYESFLDKNLFEPLGMKDTTFWPAGDQLTRLANAYKPNAAGTGLEVVGIGQLTPPYDNRARTPMPAGGLFSTTPDMLRFAQMLLNGGTFEGRQYLTPASFAQILKKQTPQSVTEKYSFGFGLEADAFGHGGALATNFKVSQQHGIAMVYLIQHAGFLGNGNEGVSTCWKAATEKLGQTSAA